MALLDARGAGGFSLASLAFELRRPPGAGALAGGAYSWISAEGHALRAAGALSLGPGNAPRGLVSELSIQPDGTGGALVFSGLSLELAALAAPEGEPQAVAPLDLALSGADTLLAGGANDARIHGDAARAGARQRGGADRLEQTAGTGAIEAAGDFFLVEPDAVDVRGGADRLTLRGDGAITGWGDAIFLRPRARADGGAFAGGDDQLSASGAGPGARRIQLGGDAAAVGARWFFTGGDDRLTGSARADQLIGDALLIDGAALAIGGDDSLQGGGGDDILFGDFKQAINGAAIQPGADRMAGGPGRDQIWGDLRDLGADVETRRSDRAGDTIWGNGGNDRLHGGFGGDTVFGGTGNDRIWGDSGDDSLLGGNGDDLIRGGDGDDAAAGGGGADRLLGHDGDDRLDGQTGADRIRGGAGGDSLSGGGGGDLLIGGPGRDRVAGNGGADRLQGGTGRDTLLGGAGNDRLQGDAGNDRLIGGPGADRFVFARGDGRDRIADFDPALDRLILSADLREQAALRPLGDHAVIIAGDLRITLDGVSVAEFDAAGLPPWLDLL